MANLVPIFGNADPAPTQSRWAATSYDATVRELLAKVIRRCAKSREQIADEMSNLVGRQITVAMLNGYTAPSKEPARFPAAFVCAFCEATGDDRLQRLVLGPRLSKLLEFGELQLAAGELREQLLRDGDSK